MKSWLLDVVNNSNQSVDYDNILWRICTSSIDDLQEFVMGSWDKYEHIPIPLKCVAARLVYLAEGTSDESKKFAKGLLVAHCNSDEELNALDKGNKNK